MRTVRDAWRDALYGPGGFYARGRGPGVDFATASTTGPELAEAVVRLGELVDRGLGHPGGFAVVDVGAGDAGLLANLAALAPDHWQLAGVERRARPAGLDRRVGWLHRVPPVRGLLLAVEWLDVVPCEVLRDGRVLGEDGTTGAAPAAAERAWLQRWWPGWRSGEAESGRSRDLAWAGLVRRLEAGLALAVDYGHVRTGRRATFTGYREGRVVRPSFDAGCDLTAHVALDSLAGQLCRQREALRALGVTGRLPAAAAPGGPGGPGLRAGLARTGREAVLLAPAGLGGFGWVSVARGLPDPLGDVDR